MPKTPTKPRTRTPSLFTPVNSRYGAPMGRPDVTEITDDTRLERPMWFRMEKIRWTDGDYDQGGAYWGYSPARGDIYLAVFEEETEAGETYIRRSYRAHTREQAVFYLQQDFPMARVRRV